MRGWTAGRFLVAMSAVLLLVAPVCWGARQAGTTSEEPATPRVAHFHLSGMVSETPMVDPFGLMTGEMTSLKDLLGRMDQASADDQVKAVVLTFDRMSLGFGQVEELRRALAHLKSAGKKVYAYAEGLDTLDYGLLCASGHLSLAPQSTLWLTGMYGESLYVKGLLDKIGVQFDSVKSGEM